MRLKSGKKFKKASLDPRFTGSEKEQCTSTCSLLKSIVNVSTNIYPPTTLTTLQVIQKIVAWQKLFLLITLIQTLN